MKIPYPVRWALTVLISATGSATPPSERPCPVMMRTIAEWVWRLAVLAALCWIGWEVHLIHEDMFDSGDEEQADPVAASTV